MFRTRSRRLPYFGGAIKAEEDFMKKSRANFVGADFSLRNADKRDVQSSLG
jgi:hypothetical protein